MEHHKTSRNHPKPPNVITKPLETTHYFLKLCWNQPKIIPKNTLSPVPPNRSDLVPIFKNA